MTNSGGGLGNLSMFDLFRMEAEGQIASMNEGLLAIESSTGAPAVLEKLMRAAHSLKGAAKMVGVEAVVHVAHVMEDCFVAAQKGIVKLNRMHIDVLLKAVDWIELVTKVEEASINSWFAGNKAKLDELVAEIRCILDSNATSPTQSIDASLGETESGKEEKRDSQAAEANDERVLRVNADQMSKILGMTSELLVENRWLHTLSETLRKMKKRQDEIALDLDRMRTMTTQVRCISDADTVKNLQQKVEQNRRLLSDQMAALDDFERRSTQLSTKLYNEVNGSRMRPFASAMTGYKRMVRDLARDLKKDVDLVIKGGETPVDRDVLEKLKAPLTHLLRNSIDHGIEKPEHRAMVGKSLRGSIKVEASHGGGLLKVSIKDDGKGINLSQLRDKVLQKGLVQRGMHLDLTEDELVDFLFLPDFSTRDEVTEVSGRGVGLDVVRDMVRELGGSVSVVNDEGHGIEFILHLPLSLSVLSAVIVEISGESYAFPVTRIDRLISISSNALHAMNGSHYVSLDGQHVGLISGSQVLGFEDMPVSDDELKAVVVSDRFSRYGIVVDRVIGQRQISVQSLDARLGKVKDISASALLEDGSPTLILDIDDVVRSIDHIVSGDRLGSIVRQTEKTIHSTQKRILVVEDSLTVREVERQLLQSRGYYVETAIDGVDGWNAVRESQYHLVITDIDMPRMDGIALVKAIKQDLHLKGIPVMIVSYKDRKEDRQRGLDAGADYYLTKGSFHDDSMMEAVVDLIGEATE